MDTNGDRHPCAYLSKSLTKKQRNYDTGDRELLAIVQALKEWRHYIQGFGHTVAQKNVPMFAWFGKIRLV
jgi:RNase H-like domain found in reverse transcriptase